MGYVIGTAGHVDHGKSTLVQALTGMDPDRLEEEKRRGMTIDLGFAHLMLPSGRLIGIVDVPGHSRFIHNMLAGVHGLDAVLLVVAADEGVMPQTVEHLQIIDLLEISHGLIALTKVDLVELEWLELVTAEVIERVRPTSLSGAKVIRVSARTGVGMDELKLSLDLVLDSIPIRGNLNRPRLPIDRVFSIRGSGTIVTGTLVDGALKVGEEMELVPGGRRIRIRGLQRHGQQLEIAEPGSRLAANVTGVEKGDLHRGQTLAQPGTTFETRRIDARVRMLADAAVPLRHGAMVMLHTGTTEVGARVIMLGSHEILAGEYGWIQLYLQNQIAANADDRFVIRLPSPPTTLAGGRFADVAAHKHHRIDPAVTASLERRVAGHVLQEELNKYPHGVTEADLLKRTLATQADLARLEAKRAGVWLFRSEAWRDISETVTKVLAHYHLEHPLRPGMPREELKSRLGFGPAAFPAVLEQLRCEGAIVERGIDVAAPTHVVDVNAGDPQPARQLLDILGAHRFSPPSLQEALRQAGATTELLQALVRSGQVIRLSKDYALTKDVYDQAVRIVVQIASEEGSVSIGQLKQEMATSRRPILALLDHLDEQHITRRQGDVRVLRRLRTVSRQAEPQVETKSQ